MALGKLRKSDERKVLLAAVLRRRTAVGVNWIAERMVMGHQGSVSRMLGTVTGDKLLEKRLKEFTKKLDSGD